MHELACHRALAGCAVAFSLAVAPGGAAAQAPIPTPESVFGFAVGAEGRLFGYDQSIDYFRRLAATSGRIRLIDVGTTSFGRAWTVAIISSPENLARIDELRRMSLRLAHPDGLSDDDARRIAREAKPIVDISGGLHASEVAGSQHTPLLAYQLLSTADEPATKEILDNTILFLWPTINPDGQDIVVNWCRARDAGQNPPPMELYQKYIGHDNNRDAYMLNVVESRVINRVWREWEPSIIYVHHQSAPFPTRIWVPPFADPVGLHVPGVIAREVNTIGMVIGQELDSQGKPGTVHMGTGFDAWYPGYIDYMPMYQNIASFWTETQGGNCGATRLTHPDSLPGEYRAKRPTPLYVSPWPGGTWTNRDAIDYMVTASIATLRYAAKFRQDLLWNRYQAGRDQIARYRAGAPYAYIIPQTQRDPVAPVELLRRMAALGVRVAQADRQITHDGVTYASGTWVIPMDQEYAELVRTLFEPQEYPDLGDDQPYDAAGWTLPYQMNVHVIEARTPLTPEVRAALVPIRGRAVDWRAAPDAPLTMDSVAAGIVPLPGGITGRGDRLLLDPAQNNSFRLINRALAERGAGLRFLPSTAGRGARWVLSGVPTATLDAWATELSVRAERATGRATSAALSATRRIGLYKGAPGNMDQGWSEWLLDTHGFAYSLVSPEDLRAGNLMSRFDVIVFASQSFAPGGGRGGRATGAGGVGAGGRGATPADTASANAGVRAVDDFVRAGGTIVAWNQGATSAITALTLPVRNVLAGLPRSEYFTGGSIMRVITDPAHPVMAGMPDSADVFVSASPAFTTLDGFAGSVLAKYQPHGSPLRSGFLLGERHIQGFAAAVDVRHGRGRAILFGFQPQWRGQPTGTFRVVFNSLFLGGEVGARAGGTPGFWTVPRR
jgi:hypothetical protein